MKIVTIDEMRRLEAEADTAGVSYAAMMELAGRAVAEAVLARAVPSETTALILAGPGNNGGDGLVCARHLHDAGAAVKVYCLKPPDESDSKVIALRQRSLFIADSENDSQGRVLKQLLDSATIVIDALFGTGARLPLKGNAAQLLGVVKRRIASREGTALPCPGVVAVDVPSGTECDTGEVDANTICANVTVTFGAAKIGQYKFPAADHLGQLIIAPIGWPDDLPGLKSITLELADATRARAALPKRSRAAHKYDFGRLLVVAGSKNYTGAAYLVGAAAIRSGAGLVTMAVPDPIHPILAGSLIEATWQPLPHANGFIAESALEAAHPMLGKADALVIGPGWGLEETTKEFLRGLIGAIHESPLLIDADGLRLLAQIEGWPDRLPKPSVLTPHPGEMAALTALDTKTIQADRLGAARKFAAQWGRVVLLKGAFTVVAAPDGRAAIEPFATPALAKAGSGDVLSGIIGSLLAQGLDPFEAAVTGAYVHGRAGEIAAQTLGATISVAASDLLTALPKVFAELGS
ncbi:MAG: NAD(P)H-hydrate dehydratase [Chloroflexi bacterium]|nr:NAD(P)H-hydrate dehydratase [Chloroflexota bacterium]